MRAYLLWYHLPKVIWGAFMALLSAIPANAAWTEINVGGNVSGTVSIQGSGDVGFEVDGQAANLTGKAFVETFNEGEECRVERRSGVGGLIAMSSADLASGSVLAIYWLENGKVCATFRSHAAAPLQSVSLEIESDDLILIRRGSTVYAYASENSQRVPLLGVEFGENVTLTTGAVAFENFSSSLPTLTAVIPVPFLDIKADLNQPGTTLHGLWSKVTDAAFSGGFYLLNSGENAGDHLKVKLEGLFPGTHELWIRYNAASSRTYDANIVVEGLGSVDHQSVNQQLASNVWLALGRFHSTNSESEASITLEPSIPGSGSISVDSIRCVWAEWDDLDNDGIADAWEGAYQFNPNFNDALRDVDSDGLSSLQEFLAGTHPQSSNNQVSSINNREKFIQYINAIDGNDSFDGSSAIPQAGIWHGARKGPKREVDAALKNAPATAEIIELHIDGAFEMPSTGFQPQHGAGLIIIPGKTGAEMTSQNLPPQP